MGLAIGAHCPLPLVQVNLSDNQLCGRYLKYRTYGPLEGTYSDVGIKAIAEALATASLTYLWYKLRTQTNTFHEGHPWWRRVSEWMVAVA